MNDPLEILVPIAEVSRQTSLARPTIYRKVKEGTFPAPIKIGGGRASRWRQSEIQALIRNAPAAA